MTSLHWAERSLPHPPTPALTITDEGLVLGRTVPAKMRREANGGSRLAIDGGEARILALLATVYGTAVGTAVFGNIRRAANYWNQGEKILADIELALAGLPPLNADEAALRRLSLAEKLLAGGITPCELLKASGLAPASPLLVKAGYDPDQPRVPAGDPDGGRWTDDGSEGGRRKDPTRSFLVPADYTPIHELPFDAKAVIPPDGVPILDPDSPTKFLMAPPHADFHEVYNAGRATYVPAANYAVGVYMAGAGYSLETTNTFAKLYALRHSSNYDAQDQLDWIERGWTGAVSGRWR